LGGVGVWGVGGAVGGGGGGGGWGGLGLGVSREKKTSMGSLVNCVYLVVARAPVLRLCVCVSG